ncbi:hypothetical protein [Rhizobium tumorigenes]|uniref:Uncharacterized protein n=1 Tax=Rhizobium tumorigenes TaxID=2041385 RepID=A0AAF1KHN0_9HYPH|nr:hypothetical protein [Rhizobium tumorigenes]WFR98252.1 hypothetical protein PR017_23150 [Rhizobium tumorigenes]
MRPSSNPNIDLGGSTASLPEVPGGATLDLYPIEPRSHRADDSLEDHTDQSEYPSASFDHDGVKLGAAEREACEYWDGFDRPTGKDLVLRARLDAIDSSAWLPDLDNESPSIFRYEEVPLGEGERRAYEEWQENAEPMWEDLVVNARTAELGHSFGNIEEYESGNKVEDIRVEPLKRKRRNSTDQDKSSALSFRYDGMTLAEPEQAPRSRIRHL